MNILQLLLKIAIQGDKEVVAGLAGVEDQARKTAGGIRTAGDSFSSFSMPATELVNSVEGAIAGIKELAVVAENVSGVKVAADYQQMAISLTTLTGSASAATRLLKDLQKMGAETPFNTQDLVGYSRMLLATGSTAATVTKELGTMTDAVAALGLGTPEVGRLSVNMSQIRASANPKGEDLKQFAYLGLDLSKIVTAATGTKTSQKGAISHLEGLDGAAAYEEILKGIDKLYGGTAVKSGGTFLGLLQNLQETFTNIALPTGALLLPALSKLAEYALWAAQKVQKLNEMTGGSAGLIVIVALLTKYSGFLLNSFRSAILYTKDLAAALTEYAVAARAATGAAAMSGVAGGAAGAAEGAAEGAAVATAAAASGSRAAKVAEVGSSAVRAVKSPMFLALAADLIGNAIGSHVGGAKGSAISDAATGGSLGLVIGKLFGPWGMAGGALLGAIGGGMYGYKSYKAEGKEKADSDKALQENTDALKALSGKMIGGGARAKAEMSRMEMERAFAKVLA